MQCCCVVAVGLLHRCAYLDLCTALEFENSPKNIPATSVINPITTNTIPSQVQLWPSTSCIVSRGVSSRAGVRWMKSVILRTLSRDRILLSGQLLMASMMGLVGVSASGSVAGRYSMTYVYKSSRLSLRDRPSGTSLSSPENECCVRQNRQIVDMFW
eukprot:c2168_g1_i2.p1 GENE.c2168_g1_i2~~c2168_g1_i2.p1  ORF type:complete len:157 (-),score=24.54 c2168_g1_i2:383-853(-)